MVILIHKQDKSYRRTASMVGNSHYGNTVKPIHRVEIFYGLFKFDFGVKRIIFREKLRLTYRLYRY